MRHNIIRCGFAEKRNFTDCQTLSEFQPGSSADNISRCRLAQKIDIEAEQDDSERKADNEIVLTWSQKREKIERILEKRLSQRPSFDELHRKNILHSE